MDEFLQFGDRVVRVDRYEEINGKMIPVIKADSSTRKYPSGRIDVTVQVPCLKLNPRIENQAN